MRRSAFLLVLLSACEGGSVVSVDLKTDLVPEIEFGSVEVDLTGGPAEIALSQQHPARSADDYVHGQRVADFEIARPGDYRVELRIYDPVGELVMTRPVAIRVAGNLSVTVLMTRDCRGVMCPLEGGDPALAACLGGRCVDPSCTAETPAACGLDCGLVVCPPHADCSRPECDGSACVYWAIPEACGASEWCNPDVGCLPLPEFPDAGRIDAGRVGRVDAGRFDAGPPVDGGCDAPCVNDGMFCNGTETCVSGACVSPGDPCGTGTSCNEATDHCDPVTCGVCNPGSISTQPCGNCGTQTRTCAADCTWPPFGACTGQGECSPGTPEIRGCGFCAGQSRDCQSDCTWGDWSACGDGGVCSPGDIEVRDCGNCGQWRRTCGDDCQWLPRGPCQNQGPCTPGDTNSQSCGNCGSGTQTQTCQDDCRWGGFGGCSGGGACSPGDSQGCSYFCTACGAGCYPCSANIPSTQYCTGSCDWGPCEQPGACCD